MEHACRQSMVCHRKYVYTQPLYYSMMVHLQIVATDWKGRKIDYSDEAPPAATHVSECLQQACAHRSQGKKFCLQRVNDTVDRVEKTEIEKIL